jgi:chromosome segregation ATPase
VKADLHKVQLENADLINQIYDLKTTEASIQKKLDTAISTQTLLHHELSKYKEKLKESDREVVVLRTKLDAALMENTDVNHKIIELKKERDMESRSLDFRTNPRICKYQTETRSCPSC